MKHTGTFRRVLQAVFERAARRQLQAGDRPLSLRKMAADIGIEVSVLSRLSRGITQPDSDNLLLVLDYLGCSVAEKRLIFHLAEIATPEEIHEAVHQAAALFQEQESKKAGAPAGVFDRFEMEVLSLQVPQEQSPSPEPGGRQSEHRPSIKRTPGG